MILLLFSTWEAIRLTAVKIRACSGAWRYPALSLAAIVIISLVVVLPCLEIALSSWRVRLGSLFLYLAVALPAYFLLHLLITVGNIQLIRRLHVSRFPFSEHSAVSARRSLWPVAPIVQLAIAQSLRSGLIFVVSKFVSPLIGTVLLPRALKRMWRHKHLATLADVFRMTLVVVAIGPKNAGNVFVRGYRLASKAAAHQDLDLSRVSMALSIITTLLSSIVAVPLSVGGSAQADGLSARYGLLILLLSSSGAALAGSVVGAVNTWRAFGELGVVPIVPQNEQDPGERSDN